MFSSRRRQRNDPRRVIESEDRLESSRELNASRQAEYMRQRRSAFRPIEQRWDHKNPCNSCGHVWLESSKAGLRNRCCQGGKM